MVHFATIRWDWAKVMSVLQSQMALWYVGHAPLL